MKEDKTITSKDSEEWRLEIFRESMWLVLVIIDIEIRRRNNRGEMKDKRLKDEEYIWSDKMEGWGFSGEERQSSNNIYWGRKNERARNKHHIKGKKHNQVKEITLMKGYRDNYAEYKIFPQT